MPVLPTVAQVALPTIKKTFGQKLVGGIGKILKNKLFQTGASHVLQQRANKKLAQYSFDKNVEMWKMQNEYNNPKNQMQRFTDAGLNPNLIYGKGTPGNAQTMPQYQGLPTSGQVYGQSIAGLQGMQQMDLQKEQIEGTYLDNWLKSHTNYTKVEQQFAITGQAINEEEASHYKKYTAQWSSEIERIKSTFWQKGVNPNDSIFLRGLVMMAEKLDKPWMWELLEKLPADLRKTEMPYFKQYKPFRYNRMENKERYDK
jgi:hypothetical protein